jgi:hypothetical protein
MGNRPLILLGRIGTILLASGLALGLVSLVPSYSFSGNSSGQFTIDAQKYVSISSTSSVYTPQLGFSISANSSDNMYVYLLGASYIQIYNWTATWVMDHYPSLQGYEIYLGSTNLTVLNAVLVLHPDVILWNSSLTKNVSHEFYPQSVLNITAVVTNPLDHSITVSVASNQLTSFAPRDRVTLAFEFLVPLGLVLAAPWALKLKLRKKTPEK